MRKFLLSLAIITILGGLSPEIQAVDNNQMLLAQTSSKTYTICKDICGATYTKKDMSEYTKYAINDNTSGINRMLQEGRLIVLRRGERVTIVENGFSIVKIKTSRGQIVYTDRENIK